MLCGLGMNALVTDSNAGSMPVIGMPPSVRPASPMWQGATLRTQLPLLADQAGLGLFSIGDIALLLGGILTVAICLRRTLERRAGNDALTEKTDGTQADRMSVDERNGDQEGSEERAGTRFQRNGHSSV